MANKIVRMIKKGMKEVLRYTPAKKAVNIPVLYGELLKDKTALITGGTSGIGLAIAEAFVRNGASVIITGRNPKKLEDACNSLKQISSANKVYGTTLDNTDVSLMKDEFMKILNMIQDDHIDILVNNAGVLNKTSFGSVTESDYDNVMDTDMKGAYFLTQIVSKYMIQNHISGNILNITSSSAIRPALNSYHLAKWGMRGFTKGLAKELSQYDIVVNAIAPGPTATSMLLEGDNNINRPSSPSGRFATPEEIGNLAVIMVSSLARMVNGDTLYATGGCGLLTFDDWD
ncbi:MAG: SDR family oxidoreductase [Anaerobutyricum hallii]|uniref:SDR family NAD(P)-dependent oxidoreductase n=1 Tax=Anaerobutyricum hallii TaxID=39488 RepID=UPI002A8374DA|nr:SDR family oxidoreductase [Anaerobutyricum hallii]MDY4576877.1 SDR family oxidoreductase [Anaerobutyricum hallii]